MFFREPHVYSTDGVHFSMLCVMHHYLGEWKTGTPVFTGSERDMGALWEYAAADAEHGVANYIDVDCDEWCEGIAVR